MTAAPARCTAATGCGMTQRRKHWGALAWLCLAGLVPSRGATVQPAAPGAASADLQQRPPAAVPAIPPGTAAVRTNTPAVNGDLLKFSNGDVLHGTLVRLGAESTLRWQSFNKKKPYLVASVFRS